MVARTSARNAVKHGFCSMHFLPFENEEFISGIRVELEEIHKPVLVEEYALINDLAIARFKMYENERLQNARQDDEKLHAGAIYDMQHRAEFRENETRWRDLPMQYRTVMESSLFGCRHFVTKWLELQIILKNDNASPSLEQICNAVLMLGNHWQIQQAGPLTRLLVGLYLAMQARPEQEIEHWVTISKGEFRESNVTLAHEIYALAPSAAEARQQMRQLVNNQLSQLQESLEKITKFHEFERESFVAKSCGLGLTDPARANEARLFHRYYVGERNHALKLERKLDAIKKTRMRQKSEKQSRKDQTAAAEPKVQQTNFIKEDTPEPLSAPAPKPAAKAPANPKFQAIMAQMHKDEPSEGLALAIAPAAKPAFADSKPNDQNSLQPGGLLSRVAWGDVGKVTKAQEAMLLTCDRLKPGPERNGLITKYFGDEGNFRHARRLFADALA